MINCIHPCHYWPLLSQKVEIATIDEAKRQNLTILYGQHQKHKNIMNRTHFVSRLVLPALFLYTLLSVYWTVIYPRMMMMWCDYAFGSIVMKRQSFAPASRHLCVCHLHAAYALNGFHDILCSSGCVPPHPLRVSIDIYFSVDLCVMLCWHFIFASAIVT